MESKEELQKDDYQFILSIQEVIENYLIKKNDLSMDSVIEFEKRFYEMKSQFPEIVKNKHPGDEETAPHYHFHQIATRVGRWLGDTLKIDWSIYE